MTQHDASRIDLLAVGDSLALPRPTDPNSATTAHQTWPFLLAHKMAWNTVWFRPRGASTSREVVSESTALQPYLATESVRLSVLQCGIVDASPRPYSLRARRLIESPSVLQAVRRVRPEWNPRRSKKLLKWWGRPWIDVPEFERNITNILQALCSYSEQVIVVRIQDPGPRMLELLGEYDVAAYNEALNRAVVQSPQASFLDSTLSLTSDGHHLSRQGHEELAQGIADWAKSGA